jgi:ABC-type multidrug transport system fused ATPase/permease subunit
MQSVAYRRARGLLASRRDLVIARVLGVLLSCLILTLLGVVALFVSLMAFRGESRFPASEVSRLPEWVSNQLSGQDLQYRLFDDTGIFPLIAENLLSNNPIHQYGAAALNRLTVVLPSLRNNRGALATLIAAALICGMLIATVSAWRRKVIANAATDVATSLRKQIHRQMYRLGQSALPTEGTGPIVNLWTREVNDIRDGIAAELDVIPRIIVLAAGLVIIALLVSPILSLFLGSLGLLLWFATRALHTDTRRRQESALRDASVQLCLLHEDLGLLRTVRVYGVGDYDRQRFDEHLERYQLADVRRLASSGMISSASGMLFGAGLALALGLLGYNVVVNQRISIATMLILFVALLGLAYPILQWLKYAKAIRLADRSARGIFEFLERKPELHQNVGAQFLEPIKDQIRLENVTLEGRSGRLLLSDVSVDIPAGSRTSIVGFDDDSKLAIACLIPRLIDPKTGRVVINGKDLREVTLESIRAQVATVLQADLIFTDSVLVNIGLGDPVNSLPRIIEAAKLTHAHNFIQDLPHGYDTVIGPLGHYLKPDEQYRIALARAYLHDPSILIIEEPNTALDDDTRNFLDDTITRLSVGRTVVMIPHRLSTVRASDHVLVLNNGHVADFGPPGQLQSTSKLYRHLMYVEFNQFATGELEAGQMSHA